MRIVKPAEERKNEILDVAEELFAEKGFDNASTNDIINRIGIARGTLYHHFGSKEEILDAIVERMTGEGISRAKAIVADKNTPLLERLTGTFLALNIDSRAAAEVFEDRFDLVRFAGHDQCVNCLGKCRQGLAGSKADSLAVFFQFILIARKDK